MRIAPACLLLFTPIVFGQPADRGIVDRLIVDLVSMTALGPMPEGIALINPHKLNSRELSEFKAKVKAQWPELDSAMRRLATDVSKRYREPVVPWSLSYVLANALAGQQLTPAAAEALAVSMIGALDTAFAARESGKTLPESPQFRAAVKLAADTLRDTGVLQASVAIVIDNFIHAGFAIRTKAVIRPLS